MEKDYFELDESKEYETENKVEKSEELMIEIDAVPSISYGAQLNRYPMIRSIRISNKSDRAVKNVMLSIEGNPVFFEKVIRKLDMINAGAVLEITEDPKVSPEYLCNVTEKQVGYLKVMTECEGVIIGEAKSEIEVLAFDECSDRGVYPELQAAFITPNHPMLSEIKLRAAELLGERTGDTSLSAYLSNDVNRVMSMAEAVYDAISEKNIIYVVPPAGFVDCGQRIRLVDEILTTKQGTCMDLTLLFASCLEAIGLNPILILQEEHIFPGVWLVDKTFPEIISDDISLITKKMADGVCELAVFESTTVTHEGSIRFDEAMKVAEKNLEEGIDYILDVKRARSSGIVPIPSRIRDEGGFRILREDIKVEESVGTAKNLNVKNIENYEAGTEGRLGKWERKLLDLGLKNTLINMRLSKTTIPIVTASIDELEDELSEGVNYTIHPKPEELRLDEKLSFDLINRLGDNALILNDFKNNRLRSVYAEKELQEMLKNLYRAAKQSLEENGANTLYITFGLLKWYENPSSVLPRYAPILLEPVEIVRRASNQGYAIRLRDDEVMMNVTMLEKLRQDFNIEIPSLITPPPGEHGVDTRAVFTIMRNAIMEQKGWDVLESAYLGIFSFNQFVMWNDLKNRTADLAKNKIVKSLMEGKITWQAKPMDVSELDTTEEVLLPLPADASQLYAIESAAKGESFVLHGPPGTGKSQTITALIANALSKNKTVLFVAEKMAALEVVQKRLERIGIGAFCLELHSNKSKKRDVLDQLKRASEVTKDTTPKSYKLKAEKIAELKKELDAYSSKLHEQRSCGYSVYELINIHEANPVKVSIKPFSKEFLKGLDEKKRLSAEDMVQSLISAAGNAGDIAGHPLKNVGCREYSQGLKQELEEKTSAYEKALRSYIAAKNEFAALTGYKDNSLKGLEGLERLWENLSFWENAPAAWIEAESVSEVTARAKEISQHYINAINETERLSDYWKPEFKELDADEYIREYQEASSKWFLPKLFSMPAFIKKLSFYANGRVKEEEISDQLLVLKRYREEMKAFEEKMSNSPGILEGLFKKEATDWMVVFKDMSSAVSCEEELRQLGIDRGLCRATENKVICHTFAESLLQLKKARREFEQAAQIRGCEEKDWAENQLQVCSDIVQNLLLLREWTRWNDISSSCYEAGLGNIVDGIREGMKIEEILPAFNNELSKGLIMSYVDESSELSHFSGNIFEDRISSFRKLDAELQQLTQKEIYCRLASNVPNFTQAAMQSSELGILQKAIRSGGRGISIRKLFDQIPNMLPRLCPCMLMSPISAAQYLDPKREPFDLVVFDEASQLSTCKAVGALARGRDGIIVGDPKQMPPTSFFSVGTVDEEDFEGEDLESILDDCLALNMPQTHLLWHYRSHHESLIAFSNSQFYENKLFTFPSVNDRERKVSLVNVGGHFERGRTRQNRAEAVAVVEDIIRRFKDKELRNQSIGVVTFNIMQQNLIDDLLSEACAKNPELEAFVYGSKEPLFIKNLENVQGDERDVILFSTCYGPDENGKMSMNFGPLNRDGGWRRLNVAVSRSRDEMMVFTSMTPDNIDLNRTGAEGVRALKAFLEYASGRELALKQENQVAADMTQSEIAQTIVKRLAELGYRTDTGIGHSDYRIDVGVIDEEDEDNYILGILLDGNSYKNSKLTRDREVSQISVLENLGWSLIRIWSMDWWDNSEKEFERIVKRIEEIKQQREAEKQKKAEPDHEACSEEADTKEAIIADVKAQPVKTAADVVQEEPVIELAEEKKEAESCIYKAIQFKKKEITPDIFCSGRYDNDIASRITRVIKEEAPITEELLIKRIIQSYGISRGSQKLSGKVQALMSHLHIKYDFLGEKKVYWREEQEPTAYYSFRYSEDENSKRSIAEIPLQEQINALLLILYEQISLAKTDLIREGAKYIGFTRVGNNVIDSLMLACEYLEKYSMIQTDNNDRLILTENGRERARLVSAAVRG